MSRAISISIGFVLFLCGALEAYSGFNYWDGVAYPERVAWWYWLAPMIGGCMTVGAALGLALWSRSSAFLAGLSMLVLASVHVGIFMEFYGGTQSLTAAALCLQLGALTYLRFARGPAVAIRKV